MKTHSLAKALRVLADVLEASHNIEVSKLETISDAKNEHNSKQLAVNLNTLYSLSKIGKKEWVKLIQDYGFKIKIDPRYSSRDIIGKLFRYLDSNPEAVNLLKNKAKSLSDEPSTLSRALDILLEDVDYAKP